jgi:hypothetical protein
MHYVHVKVETTGSIQLRIYLMYRIKVTISSRHTNFKLKTVALSVIITIEYHLCETLDHILPLSTIGTPLF